MASIHIRHFQPEDTEDIVALWHDSKRAAFTYVEVQQRYTLQDDRRYFQAAVAKECKVWLATINDQLVGFMALKADLIDLLFVARGHQRFGVGTALLRRAQEICPRRLRAYTFQKNLPSRTFFEKHGFEAIRFGSSPAPENEPDVEYEWRPAS